MQAKKKLGITVEALTPLLAQKYNLEAESGMLITEVAKDSISSRAGLKPGDVIIQLGRYNVGTLEDFATLLQHLPETGKVRIGVQRGEQSGYGILEF